MTAKLDLKQTLKRKDLFFNFMFNLHAAEPLLLIYLLFIYFNIFTISGRASLAVIHKYS